MPEQQEQKERQRTAPGQVPEAAAKELPLDTRLLSDAVVELNISRKNVGIYPPGHIQITKSIARAYEALLKLFEVRAEMTLGVAKDTLFVGQDYLDRANPVYRDFALALYNQGVAAVTFMRDMDQDELARFHRILTTRPEEIKSRGGLAVAAGEAGIPHIRVTSIDYAGFHATDEQEISKDSIKKKEEEQEGVGLWGDFVSHLSAGTIAMAGKDAGVSLKDAEQADPAELARLLNERKLDPQAVLQSYDRVISSHVRIRAEQKQLSRDQTDTLRNLNDLIKDLHPDLRKQFLAVTFERTSDASPAVTEEVMGGLTDDMVIDMLQQASSEGKEISPTLTGLLQKLAGAGDGAAEAEGGGRASGGAPSAPLSPEQAQALFKRENYEQYVSAEYEATLGKLSQLQPGRPAAAGTFPIEDYAATMTEERLDYQIGKVLLGFIDEEISDGDYGEFLKKVVSNLPELVSSGQFALLHDTFETLRLHSREKKSMTIRSMVDIALRGFRDPAFIGSVVDAWALCADKEKTRAAGNFLLSLGPDALSPLLDLYGRDETAGGKRALFDLLCRFGNAAAQEAVKRLGDKRPFYVRNLLMLIRWGWDASVVPAIRPLVRHRDRQVRLEAVTALLRFRDASAIHPLRELIKDDDPDVAALAMSLAGQYRVRAVVDLLLKKLKKAILFETDYRDNEDIIRELGEIGDPASIPDLERIAKGGWPLFPTARNRMKAVLFESLGRYPRPAVAGLIAIGVQSEDPRLQRACKKLGASKP